MQMGRAIRRGDACAGDSGAGEMARKTVDVALRGEKGGTARVAVDSPNPETAAAILAACADAGFPPSGEVMVVA